jgi:hypothetical protein
MKIYVITGFTDSSVPLEAWSNNYAVVKSYYDNYKERNPDAEILEYDSRSFMDLPGLVSQDFEICLNDLLDIKLNTTTSQDGMIYAIYKEKYADVFDNKYILTFNELRSYIIHDISSSLILVLGYIISDFENELWDVASRAIEYSPIEYSVDMVRFWYYAMNDNRHKKIANIIKTIEPEDTVFIINK